LAPANFDTTPCPKCYQPVTPTDYFCPKCGSKLRATPLSTSTGTLVLLAIKTLLLPPFGILWGIRYLRQSDDRSKLVGWVVIIVTILETIWMTFYTINLINSISTQINQQTQLLGL
jgi:hypothetical protein